MIYLDNAATTFPKPRGVIKAMESCLSLYCGNPGRSGHDFSIRTGEEIYKCRKRLGELIGINNPARIAFFQNTTMALNQGIKGVLLPGQHVVTTAFEHNSVLRPLQMLSYQGISFDIAEPSEDGSFSAENILSLINPKTKMVVMAHAMNTTGQVLPVSVVGEGIRKINEKRKQAYGNSVEEILFFVDAAQSLGCIPISVDEMNIDMLAAPGHKGLFGPQGTGFLYVREGIELMPILEGGTGTESKRLEILPEMPEALEAGTLNSPGIVGLSYGVEFIKGLGIEKIADYERSLMVQLKEALENIKGIELYDEKIRFTEQNQSTPVLLFNIKGMPCEEVAFILNRQYKIAVRAGYHCAALAHKALGTGETGAVRISAGPFNTVKEIKATVDAIYRIASR